MQHYLAMQITDEKIAQLAHLARLEFNAEQNEQIKADLERILDFCEKLREVDTSGVDPLIYLTQEFNHLRDDEIRDTLPKEEALRNAPAADSDYFKVPKVIRK